MPSHGATFRRAALQVRPDVVTKSSIMLGLGEQDEEIQQAGSLADVRRFRRQKTERMESLKPKQSQQTLKLQDPPNASYQRSATRSPSAQTLRDLRDVGVEMVTFGQCARGLARQTGSGLCDDAT